jgi:hemophore-related protein
MSPARRLTAAAAVLGAGAALFGSVATAAADPAPGCTAADVTSVETGVAGSLTAYLFSHPDVNSFFTGIQGLPTQDAFSQSRTYFAANPSVKSDIDAIRQPVLELRTRCNIPTNSLIRGVL